MTNCKNCNGNEFKDGHCAYCGTEWGFTGEPIVDNYTRVLKRKKILEDEGFTLRLVEIEDHHGMSVAIMNRNVSLMYLIGGDHEFMESKKREFAEWEENLKKNPWKKKEWFAYKNHYEDTNYNEMIPTTCISSETCELDEALEVILRKVYKSKIEKIGIDLQK